MSRSLQYYLLAHRNKEASHPKSGNQMRFKTETIHHPKPNESQFFIDHHVINFFAEQKTSQK